MAPWQVQSHPGQVAGLHSQSRRMCTVCAAASHLDGGLGKPPSTSPDRGRLQAAVVICDGSHQVRGSKGADPSHQALFSIFWGGSLFFPFFLSPLFPSPLSRACRFLQLAAPDPRRSPGSPCIPGASLVSTEAPGGVAAGERPLHSRLTTPDRSSGSFFQSSPRPARRDGSVRQEPPSRAEAVPLPQSTGARAPERGPGSFQDPRGVPVQGGRVRRGRRPSISSAEVARPRPPF
ncbi:hypothetical protein NDU88_006457 [Pleurodeles waltl]|uniref:Uncharacterized protein n=1 Tax=Pleurodeles waltl TaxID=8319 RepID=A0AAV7TDH8_PLEWA|nr:hypothetical protein NDU88_006457 [Pleurodeles waltl]